MALDKSKYAADLVAVVRDMETVYFKALDVFKRFDGFSDEVNALATGGTTWTGTTLTKDEALDLIIAAKEYTFFAQTGQTEGPRDNLASMARARNIQG